LDYPVACRRDVTVWSIESVLPFVLRRLLATIPVMGVVALFVFALLRLTPGDPAAIIAGDYATPQDIARIRAGLGLDRPLARSVSGSASWPAVTWAPRSSRSCP